MRIISHSSYFNTNFRTVKEIARRTLARRAEDTTIVSKFAILQDSLKLGDIEPITAIMMWQ